MASTVLPNGIIVPEKFSRDWYADLYHNWQELDNLLGGGGGSVNDGTLTIQKNGDTVGTFSANQSTDETVNIEVPTKTSDLSNDSGFITGVSWNDVSDKPSFATVATSGSYDDLSDKPTIPTVNDATLTIQQNDVTVDTFTANSSTDKTVNISVPTKTSDLNNDSGFITGVSWNDVSDKPSFATVATSGSYTDLSNKPTIPTVNDATLTIQQNSVTVDTFTANSSSDKTVNITVPTNTNELTNGAGFITADYAVPRSGGAVMTGDYLARTNDNSWFAFLGGKEWENGASLFLFGKGATGYGSGQAQITAHDGNTFKNMLLKPDGTWTWNGTACQILSDQRLKQQIAEIDDKLLDAWEDVELSQFKYNDAVEQKGKDKARLHTGFVVQQIDSACKKHGVDISTYGLYCHEVYPEETEEVEVEQADGTKVKEKKVIREASEHYSLRYTEALIVECKYLRRCVARLTARIEELEKGNNSK